MFSLLKRIVVIASTTSKVILFEASDLGGFRLNHGCLRRLGRLNAVQLSKCQSPKSTRYEVTGRVYPKWLSKWVIHYYSLYPIHIAAAHRSKIRPVSYSTLPEEMRYIPWNIYEVFVNLKVERWFLWASLSDVSYTTWRFCSLQRHQRYLHKWFHWANLCFFVVNVEILSRKWAKNWGFWEVDRVVVFRTYENVELLTGLARECIMYRGI